MKTRKSLKFVSQKYSSKVNALKNATNYLNFNIGIIIIKIMLLKMKKFALILKI